MMMLGESTRDNQDAQAQKKVFYIDQLVEYQDTTIDQDTVNRTHKFTGNGPF